MSNARLALTAVFEDVENGWTQARIVELPGVITAAPTAEEAHELLLDALREYLLALGQPEDATTYEPPAEGARRVPVELIIGA